MPAYRKTSKYSKDFTNEMTGRIAVILAEATEALTINEIQDRDINLIGITSQKMARMLNHLVEMGMAAKSKTRSGKMCYRSIAAMEEDGIDTSLYLYGANMYEGGIDVS